MTNSCDFREINICIRREGRGNTRKDAARKDHSRAQTQFGIRGHVFD